MVWLECATRHDQVDKDDNEDDDSYDEKGVFYGLTHALFLVVYPWLSNRFPYGTRLVPILIACEW